jgi:hypothetical protein
LNDSNPQAAVNSTPELDNGLDRYNARRYKIALMYGRKALITSLFLASLVGLSLPSQAGNGSQLILFLRNNGGPLQFDPRRLRLPADGLNVEYDSQLKEGKIYVLKDGLNALGKVNAVSLLTQSLKLSFSGKLGDTDLRVVMWPTEIYPKPIVGSIHLRTQDQLTILRAFLNHLILFHKPDLSDNLFGSQDKIAMAVLQELIPEASVELRKSEEAFHSLKTSWEPTLNRFQNRAGIQSRLDGILKNLQVVVVLRNIHRRMEKNQQSAPHELVPVVEKALAQSFAMLLENLFQIDYGYLRITRMSTTLSAQEKALFKEEILRGISDILEAPNDRALFQGTMNLIVERLNPPPLYRRGLGLLTPFYLMQSLLRVAFFGRIEKAESAGAQALLARFLEFQEIQLKSCAFSVRGDEPGLMIE